MKDPIGESRSLRRTAAQTRSEAIQSQLTLAVSFCNLAETEISLGEFAQATVLLGNVQKITDAAGRHLQEHGHVISQEVLLDLEKQCHFIESRAGDLKKKLTP